MGTAEYAEAAEKNTEKESKERRFWVIVFSSAFSAISAVTPAETS